MTTIPRLIRSLVSGSAIVVMCAAVTTLASAPKDAIIRYTAESEVIHVDNLYLSSQNPVDDLYLVFSPGVEISAANRSLVSYAAGYTHHFTSYRDNSRQNNDFSDFKSNISYNSGVLLASAHFTYAEFAVNTVEVSLAGDLVEWDQTQAGANLRYEFSDLTAVRLGVNYNQTDYEPRIYTDIESLSVPLNFYYAVSPNLDLTAGARLRRTDTFSAIKQTSDYEDTFYYVGAVGELFSPKLRGDVKFGYQNREYRSSNTEQGSSSYDVSVVYAADPKTSLSLSLERDYRTSAAGGLAYALTDFTLGLQYHMSNSLSFSGAVAIGDIEYQDSPRAEDVARFNIGSSYRPNDYLTFRVRYVHTEVDGNNKGGASDYDKNEFVVSASVRY